MPRTATGRDWSLLSEDCQRHATRQGWCKQSADRFDFAAAYRDLSTVPEAVSSGRYSTTGKALTRAPGTLETTDLMELMRDHYDGGAMPLADQPPDSERCYSLCIHADPVGTTTASMVCSLHREGSSGVVWIALGSPCLAPYLPVFVAGRLPAALLDGGVEATSDAAWWRFKALALEVDKDPTRRAPVVREHWRRLESLWQDEVGELATRLPESLPER